MFIRLYFIQIAVFHHFTLIYIFLFHYFLKVKQLYIYKELHLLTLF